MQPLRLLLHLGISSLSSNDNQQNNSTMKRSFFFLAIMAFISNITFAQFQKEFNVSNFNGLEISNAFVVEVHQGASFKVVAHGESKDDLANLRITTSGKTLTAKFNSSNWSWGGHKSIRLDITMPTLQSLDFSGAVKANIVGFNDLENLNIVLSGASKTTINTNADKISAEVSGASKLILQGKCSKFNLEASGASNVEASNLQARDADVEASGASHANIYALKTLDADASGASKITYRGNPAIRQESTGASSIRGN